MKSVIITAIVTAVLVAGLALGVGEWAAGKANETFDGQSAEIIRLENEADIYQDNYWESYDKWNAQVGRQKAEIKKHKKAADHWTSVALELKSLVDEELNIPELPKFTDLIQTSLKGVVHLQAPQWQGSGFVVGPRHIVTARHCVEGVNDFVITTHDGHKLRATRAISDKEHDVAHIWIDDLTCIEGDRDGITCSKSEHKVVLNPLRIGSIKDCVLGQGIYVIGSPYGKVNFNSLTKGIISGVDSDWSPLGEDYGWEVAFTVDSAGHPGNSGGPVFSMDGVVRGILVGGFSPVLISVMPCDLFISDMEAIRLMFVQDKYEPEKVEQFDAYYNYNDDNEYY